MNTQNNDNIEKTQEDMESANNPENERKLMIEQLRKTNKKTLKFMKLPPPRTKNDDYVMQNKKDLIIKAVSQQSVNKTSDSLEDLKIEKVIAHYTDNLTTEKEQTVLASILKKKRTAAANAK